VGTQIGLSPGLVRGLPCTVLPSPIVSLASTLYTQLYINIHNIAHSMSFYIPKPIRRLSCCLGL